MWKSTCKAGVENIYVRLQHGACNSWRVIMFTKTFDLGLDWKFQKVIQRSTSNLTKILMWRTLLPVMLQHDAVTFRGITAFRKSCHSPPFEHDLVWKVRKINIKLIRAFDMENIPGKLWNDTGNSCWVIAFTRQIDLELVWKFKKVTQRSMLNSSEILM